MKEFYKNRINTNLPSIFRKGQRNIDHMMGIPHIYKAILKTKLVLMYEIILSNHKGFLSYLT